MRARQADTHFCGNKVNPDDDVLGPEDLERPPQPLPVDDVGADALRVWLEYDVAGGGSAARFTRLHDATFKVPHRAVLTVKERTLRGAKEPC
jgi:hypothetical protein